MKKVLAAVIAGVVILATGCGKEENPAGPGETDGFEAISADIQNSLLGRGINFGNALEAPNEGEWGVTLKEEYFELVKQRGFNSIRLPVKWTAHALSAAPYTIDKSFFNRIDWAVNEALKRGMHIIINIHHYDEMMVNPTGEKERFLGIWRQISEHYAGYSNKLLFEILNEPNGALTSNLWNEYLAAALQVIREKNPGRNLIVSPAEWGSMDGFKTLTLPKDDKHIIVTFHYYQPYRFTHQGAEWVEGSDEWLGTKWTGSMQEVSFLKEDMDRAAAWGILNQRPLYLGEFGAYYKADMASRVLWTRYTAREAEARNVSWGYWEFCSGFGIYDAVSKKWHEALAEALIE